jgi:beta-lactamase class A
MPSRRLPRASLIILLLLATTMLSIGTAVTPSTQAQDAIPLPTSDMDAQIPMLLATCDSVFGVIIIDAHDDVVFEQNADVPFVSASLYKLVLLVQTLARVEDEELALDQVVEIQPDFFLEANGEDSYFSHDAIGYEASIEELVYATGAYSSNAAALALVSLTSRDQLEVFANELGLSHTRYWLDADDVAQVYGQIAGQSPSLDYTRSVAFIESITGDGAINLTTPRDMATFFRLLRDDQLVSPLVSWRLKHVLNVRVINDRIPALLPRETNVVHKTGNLEGVLHDVGIVETGAGPVIAITMAQAATDMEVTRSIEQRLGLLAYQIGNDTQRLSDIDATPVATPENS